MLPVYFNENIKAIEKRKKTAIQTKLIGNVNESFID